MVKIKNIKAREIKDSRGNPTIEVELETDKGVFLASVPSGASTGKNEALELRDEDGKGVNLAIKNVNEIIAPKLKGKNPENQEEIDQIMIGLDGTENKSKLGANAILGVSLAVCRAGAGFKKIPLYRHVAQLATNGSQLIIPLPMFNILNGGVHAKNALDIQEFMVVPQKNTFAENLILCNKIFQNLKVILDENYGGSLEMGDEGGFAPKVSTAEQALYLLKSAINKAEVPMAKPSRILDGEAVGTKIAIDCASSEFYKDGKYVLEGKEFTRSKLLEFYKDLINRFPIISIEDPYNEEDWEGWKLISNFKFQISNLMIIGDDLTTTNIKRIKEAHNKLACNGVILKLNQIGTVSETIEAGNLAKSFGWKTIVSHRSGETMDDFIADLAVGISADFIKSGSPAKEERMVKYKRLLQIEQELALGK
ncbi:MAG: phosphopyruvate hydratase [Patescibacteria group bacterium]